jgi:bacterioferritin (cytochrome b1)
MLKRLHILRANKGVLTMTHSYQSPLSVYEQLGSIRLSAAERREAIAHMRQAESIADLIVSAARPSAASVGRV